jgi:hypothetical protein
MYPDENRKPSKMSFMHEISPRAAAYPRLRQTWIFVSGLES